MISKLKEKLKSNNKWFLISLVLMMGIFLYAGSSFAMKATGQAEFCSSCHVMNQAARTYLDSVHAGISCNDCHAPHQPLAQTTFKAKAAFDHISANISGNIDDVIHAKAHSKAVVNQNCMNCHQMTNKNVASNDVKQSCTDCHRQVPHFSKKPIGERKVAGE
ncbi:MAG: NapC/NirT family cytochrome c [Clostridia bacterium]|nr:NapC/NirT family cytochrome c [Clostridia bacterium]